jgi:hypothetical protein
MQRKYNAMNAKHFYLFANILAAFGVRGIKKLFLSSKQTGYEYKTDFYNSHLHHLYQCEGTKKQRLAFCR